MSYIENGVSDDTPRSTVHQVAPTASRPNYFPPRPSPTQLSFQRLSGGYELPKPNSQSPNYVIDAPHLFASTPRPFALHSTPTPHSAYIAEPPQHQKYSSHSNYDVDLQNVEIETYNTAPHHFAPQLQQQQQQLVSPGRIVFPTAPTLYNDIHVLPSPRSYPYATTAPYGGKVSPKSTSIVASPATYANHYHPANAVRPSGTSDSPAKLYYLATGYNSQGYQAQLQQPLARQQYYLATVPHSGHHSRRNAEHQPSVNVGNSGAPLLIRPVDQQALYYKQ